MPILKDIEEILNPADPSLAGLIPIGSTVAGGLLNNNAAGNATGNQVAGVQAGMDTVNAAGAKIPAITGASLEEQRKLLNPYTTAGGGALDQLSEGLKPGGGLADPFAFDESTMLNDPGYQFRVNEGRKGIDAAAGARRMYNSGGTLKQLDQYNVDMANQHYGQDYSRAENTFNTNKEQRLKALQQLTGTGLTAAGTEASDIGHAADQNVQGVEWTATMIADLLGQKADALAAGDIGKANSITQTLNGIAGQVSGNSALKKIYDAVRGPDGSYGVDNAGINMDAPEGTVDASSSVPELAGIGSASGIGSLPGLVGGTEGIVSATSTIPALAGIGETAGLGALGAVPELAGTIGSAGLSGAGGGGVAPAILAPSTTGSSGLGAAAIGFLTNPITIGAGIALIAATALIKSQAHWEANDMVENIQNPFTNNLSNIKNSFDDAMASGQLDRNSAQQLRDQTQALLTDFNNKVTEFAKGGDDKKTVALQAMKTMADTFGARPDYPNLPSYSKILGGMDAQIAQLPEAA